MSQIFSVQYASRTPNNECETCGHFLPEYEDRKDSVWCYCPDCGRTACKVFLETAIYYDSSCWAPLKNLKKVPSDYIVYFPQKEETLIASKIDDLLEFDRLLRKELTENES